MINLFSKPVIRLSLSTTDLSKPGYEMQTPKNNFQRSCSFSFQPKGFPTTDNETAHSSNIRSGCSLTTHTDCRSTACSSRTPQHVVEKGAIEKEAHFQY